jgi:tetratricopeptide (TPR) repeat protein
MQVPGFLLTFALITGIPLTMKAGAETPDLQKALQQAKILTSHHQYQEALSLLEGMLAQAARDNNEFMEGAVSNAMGIAYEKERKFTEAENAYDRSIVFLGRSGGENSSTLIQPLCNLASLLYEAGQFSRAETLLLRDIAVTKLAGSQSNADLAMEMTILGKVYVIERKFPLAREIAEESLRIFNMIGQVEGLGASFAHAIIGAVYTEYGRFADAEVSLQRTLAILNHAVGPKDSRVGEATANLGMVYFAEGATDKAEPLFEKAHELFQTNGLNSLFVRQFLAYYATIERREGNKKKAKELDKEAGMLASLSPEAKISRYVVDARSFQ